MILEVISVWLALASLIAVFRSLCIEKAHRLVPSTEAADTSTPVDGSWQFNAPRPPYRLSPSILELQRWRERVVRGQPRPDSFVQDVFAQGRSPTPSRADSSIEVLRRNWRVAVAGLVELADRNLYSARTHFLTKLYGKAFQEAALSIENIARALLYCHGVDPYPGFGQDEPLRMLTSRLSGDTRGEFVRAVDRIREVVRIYADSKNMSLGGLMNHPRFREDARVTLDAARDVVSLFRQLMVCTFGDEIPELRQLRWPEMR